jgi:hypothetical protein
MNTIFKETPDRKASPKLLAKMKSIVETVIPNPKFRSDFEINDKATLDRGIGAYAWYVYDCGTHLMPLNDMNEVMAFQREWLGGMKAFEGKKDSGEDRLYVINVLTGDIRRVFGFKEEVNLADRLRKSAV